MCAIRFHTSPFFVAISMSTLVTAGHAVGCHGKAGDSSRGEPQPTHSQSARAKESSVASARKKQVARAGRRKVPLVHPRARFEREWTSVNRVFVRYRLHVEGSVDCATCRLLGDVGSYYQQALQQRGWVRAGKIRAKDRQAPSSAGYYYRHDDGVRIAVEICGTTDWSRARNGKYRVAHQYSVTFILPKKVKPAVLFGSKYKERRVKKQPHSAGGSNGGSSLFGK